MGADKQLNCEKINRKSDNEIEKDKRRESECNSGARETEAEGESRKQEYVYACRQTAKHLQ